MQLKLPIGVFTLVLEKADGNPRKGVLIEEAGQEEAMPGTYRYRLPEGLHGQQYRIRLENPFEECLLVRLFVDGVPVGEKDPYNGHTMFRFLPGEERTIVGHGLHGVAWIPFVFGDHEKKGFFTPTKVGTLQFQIQIFQKAEFTVEFVY